VHQRRRRRHRPSCTLSESRSGKKSLIPRLPHRNSPGLCSRRAGSRPDVMAVTKWSIANAESDGGGGRSPE
jgi:hypothetical protein